MLVLKGRVKPVERLAFSFDSRLLAAVGRQQDPIEVWSLNSPTSSQYRLPVRFQTPGLVCLTADGLLLTTDRGTQLVAFDLGTGAECWRVEPAVHFVIAGLSASADGKNLATAFLYHSPSSGGDYRWWRLNGRGAPTQQHAAQGPEGYSCDGVVLLANGQLVASEYRPGTAARLRALTPNEGTVAFTEVQVPRLSHLATNAAGDHIVAQCERAMWVWRTESFGQTTPRLSSKTHFTGAAFHPSGRYLAATSNDATVKLYDTTTWELARTLTWNAGKMRSVAFSPDGTLAAAGSDSGRVVLWDVDL